MGFPLLNKFQHHPFLPTPSSFGVLKTIVTTTFLLFLTNLQSKPKQHLSLHPFSPDDFRIPLLFRQLLEMTVRATGRTHMDMFWPIVSDLLKA